MSRHIMAGCAFALALTVASPASAQVGGLIKKAKEKAAVSAGVQQPSTDRPARLPGPEVTRDVVEHLLTALKAEKAAKDRWAANEEKRNAANAAAEQERQKKETYDRMDPQTRHVMCTQDQMQKDPEYAKLQKLGEDANAASKKNDTNKMMEISTQMAPLQAGLQQRADSLCTVQERKAAASPKPEQKAIQNAPETPPEETGAKAGGFSVVDYGQLKELIYTHVYYGKRSGLTDAEAKAVDPKAKELKEALKAIGIG